MIFGVDSLQRCGKVIICSGLKLYLVSPTKVKTLDRSTGVILVENQYGDNWNKNNKPISNTSPGLKVIESSLRVNNQNLKSVSENWHSIYT